ncbi:flavodoxin reductase family protein [Rhizobium leguminosarum bv. trifolii WSM597]|uniref:Flavodoxin reductase family protein n=1 Tax=Rhizobium leguminosarum bv. trifolii WSM597 TaxID=754764 RepID=J0H9M7_RHILT|nr:PDR/VanB family oxidoreductase [Rhizobium leguminosarum]EJB07110.1 flavodoxin reductase family protein [Rhizobium leguminosarum bv. trifolii WSM597]
MTKAIRTVKTTVKDISEPLTGIKILVLEDEDQWELPPFRPGAHIDLHLGKKLVRTYSLCNAPHENSRYVLGIKKEDLGRGGSRFVHENLQVGDRIDVSLPRGGMELDAENTNIFVAGGIGVTPFVSAIRYMERQGRSNYVLYWSSNGPPSIPEIVRPAIDAGRVHISDTRHDPFPDYAAIVSAHGQHSKVFCCGPEPMLKGFEQAVLSWPAERVHIERFSVPKLDIARSDAVFEVVLARSGLEAIVDPGANIVHVLEELDADISFSCEGGICGACRTPWIEGPPIHNDRVLTPAERQKDVIVCVAGCAGPRLVLDA